MHTVGGWWMVRCTHNTSCCVCCGGGSARKSTWGGGGRGSKQQTSGCPPAPLVLAHMHTTQRGLSAPTRRRLPCVANEQQQKTAHAQPCLHQRGQNAQLPCLLAPLAGRSRLLGDVDAHDLVDAHGAGDLHLNVSPLAVLALLVGIRDLLGELLVLGQLQVLADVAFLVGEGNKAVALDVVEGPGLGGDEGSLHVVGGGRDIHVLGAGKDVSARDVSLGVAVLARL